jgi:phospholipase/carboxylesterase|tara:strand:- start:2871 stop:3524 length:654 start_codon:yes stop_codon:yes gene_type:complete
MQLSLKTKIIEPDNNNVNNAVILLHGYGGDGEDISMLTLNWKRFLPNTVFLSPNGHEKCNINPNGFQWFDLSIDDPQYILEQSLKAEKVINLFIDEVKQKYNLDSSKICISGFSQGCMMSINIGLTSKENFACVVGFSGKIIDKKNLSERITSKPKIMLIHGDLDSIVPSNYLLDAKDFLIREKVDVDTKIINNCEHNIPIEASSLALEFIKKNINK